MSEVSEKSDTLNASCMSLSRISSLEGPGLPAQAPTLGLPGRGDGQMGGEAVQSWEPEAQLQHCRATVCSSPGPSELVT